MLSQSRLALRRIANHPSHNSVETACCMAHNRFQPQMVVLRISRDTKVTEPDWRRGRLYREEADHLVRLLNSVRFDGFRVSENHNRGLFGSGVHYGDPLLSTEDATEFLMRIVCDDLAEAAEERWLADCVTSFLGIERSVWLEEEVGRNLRNQSPGRRDWFSFTLSLILKRRPMDLSADGPATQPGLSTGPERRTNSERYTRFVRFIRTFHSDQALASEVIALRVEAENRERGEFFAQRRRSFLAMEERGDLAKAKVDTRLRALDFFEEYPAEVDAYFAMLESVSELSAVLAIHVFTRWVNEKLETSGLGFRLALDRLTSSYRLIPRELHSKYDPSNSIELRLVTPDSTLSACFIAYMTRPGILERVEKWIEAMDLIDQLACAHVLNLFRRCRVCRRWMFILHSRRAYCSGKCRYKLWAGTPGGRQRGRKASAAYRRRFREATRKDKVRVTRRRGQ